jgi:hypothetical protein
MTQRSAEVARALWVRDAVDVGTPEEAAAAADRVCAQLRTGLARWIGSEGYRTLLNRALEAARAEYPALRGLSCIDSDGQEVAAAVREHGAAQVTAGIVAVVATVIDLLGRIVGEEMAVELVNQMGAASPRRASSIETGGGRDG